MWGERKMVAVRLFPISLTANFCEEVSQHFFLCVTMYPICMHRLPLSGSVPLSFNLCIKVAAALCSWLCPIWNKELYLSCLVFPTFSSNCPSLVPLTSELQICSNTDVDLKLVIKKQKNRKNLDFPLFLPKIFRRKGLLQEGNLTLASFELSIVDRRVPCSVLIARSPTLFHWNRNLPDIWPSLFLNYL